MSKENPSSVPRASRSKLSSVFRLLFSVLLLLSTLWSVQVMSSAYLRVWGDRAKVADKIPSAERLYKISIAIDPQNWQAHLGLGKIYGQARYYEIEPSAKREWALKEKEALRRAYRHDTKRSEITYELGRAELALSMKQGCTEQGAHREAGLGYLREAAQVSRFNDYYWRKFGIELRKAGLYDEALAAFEHAQQLDPSNLTVKRNIQWLKEKRSENGGQTSDDQGLRSRL